MNVKRFWLTSIVLFFFIWVYEWLCHGVILASTYEATASLWRTHPEMQARIWSMLVGFALLALMFTYFYARCASCAKGVTGGLRFGFGLGLIMAVPGYFIMFVFALYPGMLLFWWGVFGVVQLTLMGLIASWLYKA